MDRWIGKDDGLFMRYLTSKWRRPETKKTTARVTIIKRITGLILPSDDDWVDSFSYLIALFGLDNEEEDDGGGEYIKKPSLCSISCITLNIVANGLRAKLLSETLFNLESIRDKGVRD